MENASQLIQSQRDFFQTGKTRELSFRINQLDCLKKAIKTNEKDLFSALFKDLRKPAFESYISELGFIIDEINYAKKNLASWIKPKKVRTPISLFPGKSFIEYTPFGVALIIAPWNYPLQLLLNPAISAMAAGNCAILKPSELAPETSETIAKIIKENFDPAYLTVVQGGVSESQNLLDQKLDKIFFTGGTKIGKIVMTAAAKNLTPITLELGGKSPCIVDQGIPIETTARRITWGKFFNAGQSCIAPDHLLVHHSIKNDLIEHMKKHIRSFFGEDPSKSPDYCRIIHEKHFQRISNLFNEEKIIHGGKRNLEDLYIEPTLFDSVSLEDNLMKEEIFGPLLPIITFTHIEEAIEIIQKNPNPLALYIFSQNQENIQKIKNQIPFGGGCINEVFSHWANPHLPMGGIGESGLGHTHGKSGFETFSHKKGILKKPFFCDLQFRYPPYRDKIKFLKKLMGR